GGIPRLPLPGTLPGGPGQVTPYGTQLGTPSQQIPQPAGLPSAVVPGGLMPGPASGGSGLPAGGLPELGLPGSPGTVSGRSQLPAVGPTSMLPSALFTDPIYGPYVPHVAPIGPVPSFGSVQPAAPTATYEKPFSDYTPPSVYSPYMNLYRWNPRGPIDNYYSLVRPFVLQNTLNQQYRQRMQTLELNNRLQQTIIQRLQQQNQLQQGTYQPGYFMNHGSFFPGY
ncbi:MAG: hypothetical protein RMI90_05110, partial [Thermoguttaceae bacterium]|nr:hypothetical protein [Thermoguttaceae bacterium]